MLPSWAPHAGHLKQSAPSLPASDRFQDEAPLAGSTYSQISLITAGWWLQRWAKGLVATQLRHKGREPQSVSGSGQGMAALQLQRLTDLLMALNSHEEQLAPAASGVGKAGGECALPLVSQHFSA